MFAVYVWFAAKSIVPEVSYREIIRDGRDPELQNIVN
jgi:hypothetical protein